MANCGYNSYKWSDFTPTYNWFLGQARSFRELYQIRLATPVRLKFSIATCLYRPVVKQKSLPNVEALKNRCYTHRSLHVYQYTILARYCRFRDIQAWSHVKTCFFLTHTIGYSCSRNLVFFSRKLPPRRYRSKKQPGEIPPYLDVPLEVRIKGW